MDNADRAQDLIDMRINNALNANKAQFAGDDNDESFCLQCGVEIPRARREAIHSCKYCIDCQSAIELKHKQRTGR